MVAKNLGDWLAWLTRVRFLLITMLMVLVVILQEYTSLAVPPRPFLSLIILWYTLATFYAILLRWMPVARWLAPLEIVCDLFLVTGLVLLTGGHESYFIPLYLLAIIMASILFSRRMHVSGRRAELHSARGRRWKWCTTTFCRAPRWTCPT